MPILALTDLCSIYQFKRTGNTEAYDTSPAYTQVNACISPTGTDLQPSGDISGSFQLFEIFFPDVTLKLHNGDKIVTGNNVEYLLAGQPYVINNQYLQFIRCLAREVF